MIQFYFMSILFNALAGYSLVMTDTITAPSLEAFRDFLEGETVKLLLGVLSVLTGLLKVLSCVHGDVPVVGDLIPALTAIASGFILLFEYYKRKFTLESPVHDRIEAIFLRNRKWFGYASLFSAFTHFLFPTVLLL